MECIWRNTCSSSNRNKCCCECKVKDCWQRCKDDPNRCPYINCNLKVIPSPVIKETINQENPPKRKRGRPKKEIK